MGMGWKVELNREHVATVRRLLWRWFWYVIFLVVIGWGFGPRLDEVLTVMFVVPLIVLVPYVVFCLAVAALKSLWPEGRHSWVPRRLARVFNRPSGVARASPSSRSQGAQGRSENKRLPGR